MTAHTPAPWVADSYDAHERGCAVIATNGPEIVTPTRGMVAWVGTIAGASFNDPERCEANARVCAAAPDMLALLVELVDIEGPCPGTAEWADKVRALIAMVTP